MSEMSVFQALAVLDLVVGEADDGRVREAFGVLADAALPRPLMPNPPGGNGVVAGGLAEFARHFEETAGRFVADDGTRGLERLLFRLVQANEALVVMLEQMWLAPGGRLGIPDAATAVEDVGGDNVGSEALPEWLEEVYRHEGGGVCEACGGELLHDFGICGECGHLH